MCRRLWSWIRKPCSWVKNAGFWQVYIAAVVVALVVIGITIYWNFFSPYRPEDSVIQYASAQLVFTVVAIFSVVFTLLYATRQFAYSLRRPDLKLVVGDTNDTSGTIKVQGITNIRFSLINRGNAIAIWFEVIVDMSKIPWSGAYTAPGWAQVGEQYESTGKGFIIRSFGRAAVFTTTALEIGVMQYFDINPEYQATHEISYTINGDWGASKKGSLYIRLE